VLSYSITLQFCQIMNLSKIMATVSPRTFEIPRNYLVVGEHFPSTLNMNTKGQGKLLFLCHHLTLFLPIPLTLASLRLSFQQVSIIGIFSTIRSYNFQVTYSRQQTSQYWLIFTQWNANLEDSRYQKRASKSRVFRRLPIREMYFHYSDNNLAHRIDNLKEIKHLTSNRILCRQSLNKWNIYPFLGWNFAFLCFQLKDTKQIPINYYSCSFFLFFCSSPVTVTPEITGHRIGKHDWFLYILFLGQYIVQFPFRNF